MYDKIIDSCRFLLHNFPEARETKAYLDSRLNAESQELFQFGYFPGISNLKVLTDLIGEEALREGDLFYTKTIEDSLFPRTISFLYFEDYPLVMPFRDVYGNAVAMVGRTLLDDVERSIKKIPKYKNTKNNQYFKKGQCLFGLFENKQQIIEQNLVYVVEGQMDVIKAMEKGFRNIVALGTSNMTSYQFSVISRYTDNIILLLDNDEAGEKGRKSAINRFGKLANIQNFYIPERFKDIDEYIAKDNIGSYEDMSFLVRG